jgi:hypothetical protein
MKKNYISKVGLFAFIVLISLADLSAQQTFTFTNANAVGRFGPTQTQVNTFYTGSNLAGSVVATGGIQQFTVSAGVYRINAFGAQGGTSTLSTGTGGLGARVQGDFTLTSASTLNILVGQMGEIIGYNTGGGGGSFVWITGASQPLVAAGGGGGAGYSSSGIGGTVTTAGTSGAGASGTAGTGGNGAQPGGGGWLSPGANFQGASCTPKCAGNTAGLTTGGASPTTTILYHGCAGTDQTGDGGFGGGSGGNGNCTTSYGGGGGGGYSGGVGQSGATSGGGGGGSYNGGTNQLNVAATNTGHGRVIITELCSVKILSSNSGSVSPAMLCSGSSLTLTTDAVSGYSWSTGQTTNSIVVAPTTNTVYSIVATSSMNCNATGVMSVIVSSGSPVVTITNPSTNICLGKTTSLTASGAITYTWLNAGVVNGQTFTPSSSAVYTVIGQNGCGTGSAVTNITVAPLPVTAQASSTLVCEGYTTALTASASVTGYTWTPGPLANSMVVVSPTANTIYTVTASDGTCSGTQTLLITTQTTPTIMVSQTLATICQGQSVTLSASGAGSGGTYSWTPGGAGASIMLSPATSTAVTVVGTNSLSCSASALEIIIVEMPPPLTVSANQTLVCSGDQIILTGSGAGSYQWTNGPGSAGYTINPTSSGVYTLTGSHTTNSCTISKTIAVGAIIPSVTLTSSVTVCDGGSVTFTAGGATTYTWNVFDTGTSGVFQITPVASSIYTLTSITSSVGVNCMRTDYATLTVNPNPTVNVTPGKETICKGETHTLTASGASTYNWSTNSGGSVITVTPSSTTIYTVTGTDTKGCSSTFIYTAKVIPCSGIGEVGSMQAISVYPNPNTGDFVVTTNTNITLTIVNSIGQQVRILSLNSGNARMAQVSDLSGGVYFITGESSNGKVSQKIIITK